MAEAHGCHLRRLSPPRWLWTPLGRVVAVIGSGEHRRRARYRARREEEGATAVLHAHCLRQRRFGAAYSDGPDEPTHLDKSRRGPVRRQRAEYAQTVRKRPAPAFRT